MQLEIFSEPLPTLEELKNKARQCVLCPLHDQPGGGVAFNDGTTQAKLMIVGEAPGEDEATEGIPFVGKAGQLLNKALAAVGIERSSVYVTNVAKHRPANNRTPTPEEQKLCGSHFLKYEIKIVNPRVIVPLGNSAMQFFLGPDYRITSVRGQWFERDGRWILPIFHPAFVLRNPARTPGSPASLFWEDIQKVKQFLDRLND